MEDKTKAKKKFAKLIREKRKESGLSFHAFSRLVGVSYQTVIRWEDDDCDHFPSRENLQKVANYLDQSRQSLEDYLYDQTPRLDADMVINYIEQLDDREIPKVVTYIGNKLRFFFEAS